MLNAFLFLGVMVMAHPQAPMAAPKSPLVTAMTCKAGDTSTTPCTTDAAAPTTAVAAR